MERLSRLTFLGTSSATPTKTRNVSCTTLGFQTGNVWMFDCGEGAQHQLHHCTVKASKINKVFITHLHGDHCFGLPGLLCTLSQFKAKVGAFDPDNPYAVLDSAPTKKTYSLMEAPTKPPSADLPVVDLYGPYELGRYVRNALTLSASFLSCSIRVHEAVPDYITDDQLEAYKQQTAHFNELQPVWHRLCPEQKCFRFIEGDSTTCAVRAAPLDHGERIFCIGYSVDEPLVPGQLDIPKLKKLGIPKGPKWGQLKAGQAITLDDGTTINAADVVSAPEKGRRMVILGDTCDSSQMIPIADKANWIVHEATYDDSMVDLAKPRGHSTARMAGAFAAKIDAKTLILTHFSARFTSSSKTRNKQPIASDGQAPSKKTKTEDLLDGPARKVAERWPDLIEKLEERAVADAAIVQPLIQQAKEGFGKDSVIAAKDFMDVDLNAK